MAKIILYLFIFVFFSLKAQDKVYYLDGNSKTCNIESITSEYIIINNNGAEEAINKSIVLLIEFRNGNIEVINAPSENVTFNPNQPFAASEKVQERSDYKLNYASLNTLALCNADISAFYEYMPKGSKFCFGVMGAYNFNVESTIQNAFLKSVSNAKKNYDLGATLNYYAFELSDDLEMYIGLMVKYTDFNFNKVKTDSIPGGGVLITYSPAKGSQLATMVTIGTHTFLNDHFFVRTIAGLGAFKLKGDYKEQFNIEINKGNTNGTYNYNMLPKMYLGINLGFNF